MCKNCLHVHISLIMKKNTFLVELVRLCLFTIVFKMKFQEKYAVRYKRLTNTSFSRDSRAGYAK